VALDDLYIAQVLLAWPVYHGERTVHIPIKRLPPSHTLSATSAGAAGTHRYWYMEDVTELKYKSFGDYVEAFLEVWDEAVRARVRSSGPVGVMMSGGLDSGAVAATAAMCLREQNEGLRAYTSVPICDASAFYPAWRFGDESLLAKATADCAVGTSLRLVMAENVSPLGGVRDALRIHSDLLHSAGNAYWLLALHRHAQGDGVRILLTGQGGNGSISWTGGKRTLAQRRTWTAQCRAYLRGGLRRVVALLMPPSCLRQHRYRRGRKMRALMAAGDALSPSLADRLDDRLRESLSDPLHPYNLSPRQSPMEERLYLLEPARDIVGANWAELGAAHGIAVRDPTADPRVISYCLSVPDRLYVDPVRGTGRWLLRSAMVGRLPDSVRLASSKGIQSADLVHRLRVNRVEMSDAIGALAGRRSASYVSVDRIEEVWELVQTTDSVAAHRLATSVLMRGVAAGLFINQAHV
jgi:asparagine synthase (glutamine-hydrolysing)